MDHHGGKRQLVQAALERYEKPLLRYAQRFLTDTESARDVVQDAFLQLWKADEKRLQENLGAWLYTVCRNRALDILRKENRLMPLESHAAGTIPASAPPPSAQLEQKETASIVLTMITGLPPNQREVMHLKFREGMSYKEISEITRLSVTNVGFLIHTAVKSIRATLAKSRVTQGGRS